MNIFKEEIDKELDKIKNNIKNGQTLSPDDLKTILLFELGEEVLHENK